MLLLSVSTYLVHQPVGLSVQLIILKHTEPFTYLLGKKLTWKRSKTDLTTYFSYLPTYLPGWHVHFKYSWPVDSCLFPRRLVASACYNSNYVFLWFKWALGRQKITENWQLYSYYTILLVISRDHNTFLKYGQIPASFWSHLPWATDKKVSRLLVWILVRNF